MRPRKLMKPGLPLALACCVALVLAFGSRPAVAADACQIPLGG